MQVKAKGGRFFCLSSLHVTGEQLHQLGGVAAVLRFPLEIDIDEEDVVAEDEVRLRPFSPNLKL